MINMSLIAAGLLLLAAVYAGRPGTGNYLRFAAILCAALALAVLSRAPGLAEAAALVVLPLAGVALGLSGLARTGRAMPSLLASIALATALFAGLFAMFTGDVTMALLTLAFGGVAMMVTGRIFMMLSGFLLLSATSAGFNSGIGAPLLALLGASLLGAGLYRRASKTRTSATAASA